MNAQTLDEIAAGYEQAAVACDQAAAHLRTAAKHVRERQGARIGAHAFAAHGHLRHADALLADLAIVHAERSRAD